MLTYREGNGDGHAAAALGQISPVAWPHINLHGRYKFNKRPELIGMAATTEKLAQLQVALEPATDV